MTILIVKFTQLPDEVGRLRVSPMAQPGRPPESGVVEFAVAVRKFRFRKRA